MNKDLDNKTPFNYSIRKGVKKKVKTTSKTKEGKVKDQVRDLLESYGSDCWYFMPVARGYTKSGIPDFIGCLNGRMFAIETKSIYSSHKVTALQQFELDKIDKALGLALVINETNIGDLRGMLDEFAYG